MHLLSQESGLTGVLRMSVKSKHLQSMRMCVCRSRVMGQPRPRFVFGAPQASTFSHFVCSMLEQGSATAFCLCARHTHTHTHIFICSIDVCVFYRWRSSRISGLHWYPIVLRVAVVFHRVVHSGNLRLSGKLGDLRDALVWPATQSTHRGGARRIQNVVRTARTAVVLLCGFRHATQEAKPFRQAATQSHKAPVGLEVDFVLRTTDSGPD